MKSKLFGLIFAALLLAGGVAQAAPVLTVDGGTATTIGANIDSSFDLGAETGLSNASNIQLFNSATVGAFGVSASELAQVTFEFLGKEAVFLNTFQVGGNVFQNGTTAPGTTFSANLDGLLPFVLTSLGAGKTALNGGPIDSPLQYAVAILSETSVIVLFDDGAPGIDLDDMAIKISVSQVPLPPAVWLLISAILGLVSFSRIRRNGTQSA